MAYQDLLQKAPAFVAAGVWVVSTLFRLVLYHLRWRQSATAGQSFTVQGATHLEVDLKKAIRPYPGMYFYIYFSGLPIRYKHQGFPMVSFFWDASKDVTVTKKLYFLMRDQHPIPVSNPDRRIARISLEGPYGTNLYLESYETVILLAESIGLAGVLPYALDLVQRRRHDKWLRERNIPAYYRDVTRKVDLLWKLDEPEPKVGHKVVLKILLWEEHRRRHSVTGSVESSSHRPTYKWTSRKPSSNLDTSQPRQLRR
ncbi:hypothetical protein DL764_007429 [Monosporascus ibericus]|uniref:FAD-binding FR-type domain-containing protein n=1 Tax=Monosporascus ibericus TaxID=155417 RepID=A0A4Q4T461_9PEZI|nr:hypothetical protein DL764_007429 [Monosporascus ibericus]